MRPDIIAGRIAHVKTDQAQKQKDADKQQDYFDGNTIDIPVFHVIFPVYKVIIAFGTHPADTGGAPVYIG